MTSAGWSLSTGIQVMTGYLVDDDNNIYIPNLDPLNAMLYKLETDSGVTTITNVSAYWDGGGLLSFGGNANCLLKDKNTYFMESGGRYEYYPTNRTGKYGVYHSRLYQVDLAAKKTKILLRAQHIDDKSDDSVDYMQWFTSEKYNWYNPKSNLVYQGTMSNTSSYTYEIGLPGDYGRFFIPTISGHIVCYKDSHLAVLYKYKNAYVNSRSESFEITTVSEVDIDGVKITTKVPIIDAQFNTGGSVERTNIPNIAPSYGTGIFCPNETYMRLPEGRPDDNPNWNKLSDAEKKGTMYYSGGGLYVWNGTTWRSVNFS